MRKQSSKYYGVSWNKRNLNWQARIYIDGKAQHVGSFKKDEEREAARMVDICLIKHNKEPRNFSWTKKVRG